jgi:hypothetical protein
MKQFSHLMSLECQRYSRYNAKLNKLIRARSLMINY